MEQVRHGKIKMRPRLYFVIGSFLTFVGLVSAIVTSVFLVGLTRFFLRSHGPMGQYRLEQMLSSFPWWAPIFAVITLVIGIWILRHYDFSYKRSFWMIVAGFILAVITSGWLLDMSGLNDSLAKRRPMQGMMRPYIEENNIPQSPAGRRN